MRFQNSSMRNIRIDTLYQFDRNRQKAEVDLRNFFV